MNFIRSTIVGFAMAASAGMAQAVESHFSGDIAHHTEIAKIPFTLATAAPYLGVWTDSYLEGWNFKPILGVWKEEAGDWRLVAQNHRADSFNFYPKPGQSSEDSGRWLKDVAAGNYLLTVAARPNYAKGTQMDFNGRIVDTNGIKMSDGFWLDGEAPIPMADWCDTWSGHSWSAGKCNIGTHWSARLVSAVSPVPEPETYALMLAGLGTIGFIARRRKKVAGLHREKLV